MAIKLKIQFGLLNTTCPIRGNEGITGSSGRVRVCMRIGEDGESRRKLSDLNMLTLDEHFDVALEEIGIWEVEFRHDEKEYQIPTNAYSGYVALDQLK